MVKPFLDPATSDKFLFVKGDKQKEMELSKIIDQAQAMPSMLPGGRLTGDVDCNKYLYEVPFHLLYDEYDTSSYVNNNHKQYYAAGAVEQRIELPNRRVVNKPIAAVVRTIAVGEIRFCASTLGETTSSSQQQHVVIVTPVQA
jgi:hypothetical protein